MRVLFTCGREPEYQRNAVLRAALARHFEVISVTDSARYTPIRYLRIISRLIWTARQSFDFWFVGFLGQPLMPVARRLTRQPILFDAFLSIYDTLCFDRRRFEPGSLPGKAAFWLDRASCRQANLVLLDTRAHIDYFQRTFNLPAARFGSIFVGCDENLFYPRPIFDTTPLVLFYGNYLPLHGVETIVRAAKLLDKKPGLRLRIIGSGMESSRIHSLVAELGVQNIEFHPPVPLDNLPAHIQEAMVCLGGHFGVSEKASRVIAGKTFQCIAMGKPTIVGDNPANRELLQHGRDAWFCRMNDPEALAEAIQTLVGDAALRARLGDNARHTFISRASITPISAQLKAFVESLSS